MVSDQITILRGSRCVMCETEAATSSIQPQGCRQVHMPLASGWVQCSHWDQALPPPKALTDRKWDLKKLDQQHLCQQPHLALLTLVGFSCGLRHQYKGPLLGAEGGKWREWKEGKECYTSY